MMVSRGSDVSWEVCDWPVGSDVSWEVWQGGAGKAGLGFDPAGLHEGQDLVRDFRQHVLGQPGHAQHLVPCAVDVVPERNKLPHRDTRNSVTQKPSGPRWDRTETQGTQLPRSPQGQGRTVQRHRELSYPEALRAEA